MLARAPHVYVFEDYIQHMYTTLEDYISKRFVSCAVLVAEDRVELEDGLLFLGCELSSLDIWPQVVGPSQSAALATPVESCEMHRRTRSMSYIS